MTIMNRRVKLGNRPPAVPEGPNKLLNRFLGAFCIAGVIATAGFLGLVIFWRSEIEKMQIEVSRLEACTRNECRLIENYKSQKNSICTWKNIQKKIDLYGLALHPMGNEQSVRMTRYNQSPCAFAKLSFPGEMSVDAESASVAVAPKNSVTKKKIASRGEITTKKSNSVARKSSISNRNGKDLRTALGTKTVSGKRVVNNRRTF